MSIEKKSRFFLTLLLVIGFVLYQLFPYDSILLGLKFSFWITLVIIWIGLENLASFALKQTGVLQYSLPEAQERFLIGLFWGVGFLLFSNSSGWLKNFDPVSLSFISLLGLTWVIRVRSTSFFCLAGVLIFAIPVCLLNTHPQATIRLATLAFLVIIAAGVTSLIELKSHRPESDTL